LLVCPHFTDWSDSNVRKRVTNEGTYLDVQAV
jgi:hypothetical protein